MRVGRRVPGGSCQSSPSLSSPTPRASGAEQQRLLSTVTQLEHQLGLLQSELSALQHLSSSCEKARAAQEQVSFLRLHVPCDRGN